MTIRQRSAIPFGQVTQKLFVLRSADMTIDTDQAFTRLYGGTLYRLTNIYVRRVTGAYGVACLGGIYNAIEKPAGGILVAAAQSWIGLSGANKIIELTLGALVGTDAQSLTPYLSLSTGNTGALTVDIHAYGIPLD